MASGRMQLPVGLPRYEARRSAGQTQAPTSVKDFALVFFCCSCGEQAPDAHEISVKKIAVSREQILLPPHLGSRALRLLVSVHCKCRIGPRQPRQVAVG